jgi:hypothetical protein
VNPRRKRIILYTERPETLSTLKLVTGRAVELISAGDLGTIEAAMRLYQQVDAVVCEKTGTKNAAITVLRLAERLQPLASRVLMVDHDAMAGVYDAVHDRTVGSLLFMPIKLDQLRSALGLDAPGAVEQAPARASDPLARRVVAGPGMVHTGLPRSTGALAG